MFPYCYYLVSGPRKKQVEDDNIFFFYVYDAFKTDAVFDKCFHNIRDEICMVKISDNGSIEPAQRRNKLMEDSVCACQML